MVAMGLLASLLCLTPFLAHIYCEDVFGIVGENFTFPVKVDKKVEEATWKKNKDKVAEWEGQNKIYFGPLSNRAVLMENGSLTIINLEKDDAGPYQLQYRSVIDLYLNFKLVVLDPLPEPKISCNISGRELVLNCMANFERPLHYTWNLSNNQQSFQKQEHSIPLEDVDTTLKAVCTIKFSQMERSSEISVIQCLPGEKGDSSYKRNRNAFIGALVLFVAVVILLLLLCKGKIKLGRESKTAQKNSTVNGSEEQEQLVQKKPNLEGGAISKAVHCENEEPEADRELKEEESAPKDKQIVKNGVNQEDTFRNSSVLANHADDSGINEGEVTQEAESGNGEHLNNSPSCSKEDM